MAGDRAWEIVVGTAWHGDRVDDPTDAELQAALALARKNEVEPILVRAYADRLPNELVALDRSVEAYRRNLRDACKCLSDAGLQPVLIKALPDEDYTYSNFDVVVGNDGWEPAIRALRPLTVSSERHPLERRTKMLLYPDERPAIHLHREVAWFDIPAIPTREVRRGAVASDGVTCLLPSPVVTLEILLAHAVFQNLAFTLGELLALRRLLSPGPTREAESGASRDGWGIGFRSAVRTARDAIARLDRMEPIHLPVPLSIPASLLEAIEHAAYLSRHRRFATAARELALRGPLVVAKRRAAYR